jgi:hypothetical protein
MEIPKKISAVYALDENPDRKNTRLFREVETRRAKQMTGVVYIRKDALARTANPQTTRVKVTIEVLDEPPISSSSVEVDLDV